MNTPDLLKARVIRRIIQRVRPPAMGLSSIFGFTLGGGENVGGRFYEYDIFNATRTVASARFPGQPAKVVQPQVVGNVRFRFPRSAEHMPLDYEKIHNQRQLGSMGYDRMGGRYITQQAGYLAQKFNNLIEFKTAAMLRGQYYYTQLDNDTVEHSWDNIGGASQTINFQIPASNKTNLGGIVGTSWATASSPIPADMFDINALSQQLTGLPIEWGIVGPAVWNNIVDNTDVQSQAGTANAAVQVIARDAFGNFDARLAALPWIRWRVISHGLDVFTTGSPTAATYTQVVPATAAIFIPNPDASWVQWVNGSEVVIEGRGAGAPKSEQFGFYAYSYPSDNPATENLFALDNSMPELTVPAAVFFATVVF
jgi:hypothetical protein